MKIFKKIGSVILAAITCSTIVISEKSSAETQSDVLDALLEASQVATTTLTRYTCKFNQRASTDAELKESGCALYGTANAIFAMTGESIDIDKLKEFAKSDDVKGWTVEHGINRYPYFSSLKNSDFAREYGFTVTGPTDGNIIDNNRIIAKQLQKGNVAVIVGVTNHYMVITDFNSKTKEYYVIESYYDKNRGVESSGWVSEEKLSTGATNVKNYTFLTFNTTTLEDGESYKIIPKVADSCAIGAIENKDFANVCLLNKNSSAAKWTAHKYGDGDYWYFSNSEGYYLDIYGTEPQAKGNVQIYKSSEPNDTQIFQLINIDNYWYITSKQNSTICIDVYGDTGWKKNSNIWMYKLNYDKSQAFTFEKC